METDEEVDYGKGGDYSVPTKGGITDRGLLSVRSLEPEVDGQKNFDTQNEELSDEEAPTNKTGEQTIDES